MPNHIKFERTAESVKLTLSGALATVAGAIVIVVAILVVWL
jgi:hypothetical protein